MIYDFKNHYVLVKSHVLFYRTYDFYLLVDLISRDFVETRLVVIFHDPHKKFVVIVRRFTYKNSLKQKFLINKKRGNKPKFVETKIR